MKVKIFNDVKNKKVPVLILNSFEECGEEIYQATKSKDYVLVEISNIDWNNDLSPWYMEKLWSKESDYSGNARDYLENIENKIIPEIEKELQKENITVEYYGFVGYSLAGLFSLFSAYHSDKIERIVSCSGSFWYPDFIDYVQENKISKNIHKIYFSLGKKEKDTKNKRMQRVEENTLFLVDYYKKLGIDTIYQENEGNHFQNPELRIQKGIEWILQD